MEWTDVDEINGVVKIQKKEGFTPKTAHSIRDFAISGSLLATLRATLKTARWVFPGRGGKQMVDFRKSLAGAVKAAGVLRNGAPMHIQPKMLRKAHITWQRARGVSDSLLQPRVGHAPGSKITSKNYTHFSAEHMKGLVLELDKTRSPSRR